MTTDPKAAPASVADEEAAMRAFNASDALSWFSFREGWLAAAPTIATPPEATDVRDAKRYRLLRDPKLQGGECDYWIVCSTSAGEDTIEGRLLDQQLDLILAERAATPPEVAPTDDARAAGWNAAIEAAAKECEFAATSVLEGERMQGAAKTCARRIRALAASPAADSEGDA